MRILPVLFATVLVPREDDEATFFWLSSYSLVVQFCTILLRILCERYTVSIVVLVSSSHRTKKTCRKVENVKDARLADTFDPVSESRTTFYMAFVSLLITNTVCRLFFSAAPANLTSSLQWPHEKSFARIGGLPEMTSLGSGWAGSMAKYSII